MVPDHWVQQTQRMESARALMRFGDFARPRLHRAQFRRDLDDRSRREAAHGLLKHWRNLTRPVREGIIHHSARLEIEAVLSTADKSLNDWVRFTVDPCARHSASWESLAMAFETELAKVKAFEPLLMKIFAPPPPIEEWYTLQVFGHRAVTSLEEDPRFRDEVRTLAVRLRHAAVAAGIVAAGSSYEVVYQALLDWLVGERGLTLQEANLTPVAKLITVLHALAKPNTTELSNEELHAKFLGFVKTKPDATGPEIANYFGVSPGTLYKDTDRWCLIREWLLRRGDHPPQGFKSKEGASDAWHQG